MLLEGQDLVGVGVEVVLIEIQSGCRVASHLVVGVGCGSVFGGWGALLFRLVDILGLIVDVQAK